jgi:AraC family transcriptional activator of pobA
MQKKNDIKYEDLTDIEGSPFLIRPLVKNIDRAVLQERPHRHNFQEIIWLKKGSGKHRIDDKILQLKPHTFYIISQGQVHDFMEGKNLSGYLIRFSNDFLPGINALKSSTFYTSLLSKISPVNEITLYVKEEKEYETLLEQLLSEHATPGKEYGRQSLLQYFLFILLIKLERRSRDLSIRITDELNSDKKKYLEFLHLLEEQYFNNHNFASYASQLSIHSRKLADIIKVYSGKAAKQLILERTLLEAKRMLTYTDQSLKEITFDLGYEDPAYFSRIFKNYTGSTPLEYKKRKMGS